MHAITKIGMALASVAAIGAVAWHLLVANGFSGSGRQFRPDAISVVGRLVDARSGTGLKDAFVIINLRGFRARGLGSEGHTGCMNGSSVVRTDNEGRYRYEVRLSDVSDRPYPDEWAAYVAPYMPGRSVIRERQANTTNLPEQVEFSSTVQTEFKLAAVDSSLEEKLTHLARLHAVACEVGNIDRGWTELHVAVLDEIHGSACESATQTSIEYPIFIEAIDREYQQIILIKEWRSKPVRSSSSEPTVRWKEYRKALREAAPDYPWPSMLPTGSETTAERPFSIDERRALCATIAKMRSDLQR